MKFLQSLRKKYRGARVLILGLGLYANGSGITAAKFFLRLGARVIVSDLEAKKQFTAQIARLQKFARHYRVQKNLVFRFGVHADKDVRWANVIVQNPGVPDNATPVILARKLKKEITNDMRLFFDLTDNPILAVTGTRGKSTTTALLYDMVKRQYSRARLGGNIGVSPLSFIFSVRPQDPVVLELSSWLLHHLDKARRGPSVAIVTNILTDHVNRYASQADYITDKVNIFLRQTTSDWTILNRSNRLTKAMGARVPGKRAWFQKRSFAEENGAFIRSGNLIARLEGKEKQIIPLSTVKLRGEHNQENILAAVMGACCFGVPISAIRAAVKNFSGLPYRLEYLGKKKGISWWNDSASTTPDATIAALKTFSDLKKVILICGGESKGVSLQPLYPYLKKVKIALVVPGKASAEFPVGERVNNLKEAVERALAVAKQGEHILLSPGTTWLPLMNEFKRGDEFKNWFNNS